MEREARVMMRGRTGLEWWKQDFNLNRSVKNLSRYWNIIPQYYITREDYYSGVISQSKIILDDDLIFNYSLLQMI